MESIFSNFDDQCNQIISRIEGYIERFKVAHFEGASDRVLPLDIRLNVLFVQDSVVDDEAVQFFVDILGRRALKDELEETCHISVQGDRKKRRLVISKKSKIT